MIAYQPVRSLTSLNIVINEGYSAALRILPIVDTKPDQKRDNAEPIKITDGKTNFKNISFKYNKDEKNVLDNKNLEFDGGKMTALVGHSGSGKSTILNLIPRFYQAQSEILIDEQPVDKCTINL